MTATDKYLNLYVYEQQKKDCQLITNWYVNNIPTMKVWKYSAQIYRHDGVCLGIPKQCILGYALTRPMSGWFPNRIEVALVSDS